MRKITIVSVLVMVSGSLFGQDAKFASGDAKAAFDGNDLVSYYEADTPQKGVKEYTYKDDYLTLMFASQANLDKFKANPKKYLPEYNGWCAIAVAKGKYVEPDFSVFKVQDGKLLFFEVKAFFNGKTAWDKDPSRNKSAADKKWSEMHPE